MAETRQLTADPGQNRVTVRVRPGLYEVLDPDEIYFLRGEGDDTEIRTRRRALYHSSEPLADIDRRLSAAFLRVHRSYVVNLGRIRQLRKRPGGNWEIKLQPPVNVVLPVGRSHEPELFRRIGRRS